MSKTISADELAVTISKMLKEYDEEVTKAVKEAAKEAGEFCCQQIKNNAKTSFKGTGAYADSWTCDAKEQSDSSVKYVVHSTAPYYRLTHLLEKGHTHWLWGKTQIPYKGRAHIRPAEKLTEKKFEQDIIAKVRKK